jgi:hypothetical protein
VYLKLIIYPVYCTVQYSVGRWASTIFYSVSALTGLLEWQYTVGTSTTCLQCTDSPWESDMECFICELYSSNIHGGGGEGMVD